MNNIPDTRTETLATSKWFQAQFPNKTTDEVWTSFCEVAYRLVQTKPVGEQVNREQIGQFDSILAKAFKQLIALSTDRNYDEKQFYASERRILPGILESIQKNSLSQFLTPETSNQWQLPRPIPRIQQPPQLPRPIPILHPIPIRSFNPQQSVPSKGNTFEIKNRFDKLCAEYKEVYREWIALFEYAHNAAKKSGRMIPEGLENTYKQAIPVLSQFDTPDWNTIDKARLDIIENIGKEMQQKILELKLQKVEKMKAAEKEQADEKLTSEEKKNVGNEKFQEKIIEKEVVSRENHMCNNSLSGMEREKNDQLMRIIDKFVPPQPTARGEKRKEFGSLPEASKKSKFVSNDDAISPLSSLRVLFQKIQLELNSLNVTRMSEGLYHYQSKVITKILIITLKPDESMEDSFTIDEYDEKTKETTNLHVDQQGSLSQFLSLYDEFVTLLSHVEQQVNYLRSSRFFTYSVQVYPNINNRDVVVRFEQIGKVEIPTLILTVNSKGISNVSHYPVTPSESYGNFTQIRESFAKLPLKGVNYMINRWITCIDEFYKSL
jgi:hypothetical protein